MRERNIENVSGLVDECEWWEWWKKSRRFSVQCQGFGGQAATAGVQIAEDPHLMKQRSVSAYQYRAWHSSCCSHHKSLSVCPSFGAATTRRWGRLTIARSSTRGLCAILKQAASRYLSPFAPFSARPRKCWKRTRGSHVRLRWDTRASPSDIPSPSKQLHLLLHIAKCDSTRWEATRRHWR